jgi:hypothetical protein
VREPGEYAGEIERAAVLPTGGGDRFSGYGVMGLPFASGHILGLRRFPASSIGPGYRSVWHRDPGGRWTFYQDQPAELACTRYFSAAVEEVREGCSSAAARRGLRRLSGCCVYRLRLITSWRVVNRFVRPRLERQSRLFAGPLTVSTAVDPANKPAVIEPNSVMTLLPPTLVAIWLNVNVLV